MLDQEIDTKLDREWLAADGRLTRFSRSIEQIVGKFKGSESTYLQIPQYYEEDLFLWENYPIKTDRPPVRESGINRNHANVG